jgi:hypothetical protein
MSCPNCGSNDVFHLSGFNGLRLMLCWTCNKEYLSPVKRSIDKRNRPITINPITFEEIEGCFVYEDLRHTIVE